MAKIRPAPTAASRCRGEFYKHRVWIRSQVHRDGFKGETQGNPHTRNCVYLITCGVCGVHYIGETKNTLLLRFTQHHYKILKRKKKTHNPLGHFLNHGWPSLQATVIKHDSKWSTTQNPGGVTLDSQVVHTSSRGLEPKIIQSQPDIVIACARNS